METDESPLKRVLDAAPTGDEHISTKWRPFKQRRALDSVADSNPAAYVFGGVENVVPSGSLSFPGSFGGGSNPNGMSSPPFSTQFEGFKGETFQGVGATSTAFGSFNAAPSAGSTQLYQSPFSFNAQPQQPTPLPPPQPPQPPRRSVNEVLMNAQRNAMAASGAAASPTAGSASATAAASTAAAAASGSRAPPTSVASWAGIQVGMTPRAPPPPQCHVCRCMLHQPASFPAGSTPAATAAAMVPTCAHCECATCQNCASACSGCEGRFCLFCAGTSYLGRYEVTLCCQCHDRASSELNGGGGGANTMDNE